MFDAGAPSLFDWPRVGGSAEAGRVAALGVATDAGNGLSQGARDGPAGVRRASRAFAPPRAGVDYGDVAGRPGEDLADVLDGLGVALDAILASGRRPLIIGGDHSLSYVPIERIQRTGDIVVVWFDAHTDFSPWRGGGSHDHKQVLRRVTTLPGVRRVVQVGYRGYTLHDESRLGDSVVVIAPGSAEVRETAESLIDAVPLELPCYLSVDIDMVDPRWAPGTSAPVPGGVSPQFLAALMLELVSRRSVVGVDLVEINPRLDHGGLTAHLGAWLLWRLLQAWPSGPGLD